MNTNPSLVTTDAAPASRPLRQASAPAATNGRPQEFSPLPGTGPTWVVTAPGRLDVMGGIAEYTGSLVLNLPVAAGLVLAARAREDATVFIQTQEQESSDARRSLSLPVAHLLDGPGKFRSLAEVSAKWSDAADPAWGIVLGAWIEASRCGLFGDAARGISFALLTRPEGVADLGQPAGLAAATLGACARVSGVELDVSAAARVCRDAEHAMTGLPCDMGDAVCALSGETGSLTQARCQPWQIGANLRLPEGVCIVGFDCGYRDPRRLQTYVHVRTAAHMGRLLIERILHHEGLTGLRMDGLLARLTMNDFVERFRDRLPTRISGAEFLERFGQTGDPHTCVVPDELYKVRSRTEHHIYENTRAAQFAERLTRYARTRDPVALHEAGELMYASHWSYGQRCGMGSVATDRLVTLLRQRGSACGIFGAKTAGRGCGGLVVALMADSPATRAVVDEVGCEYERTTQRVPTLIDAPACGVLRSEPRKAPFSPGDDASAAGC